ncbi:serine/threonine-protein kinase [Streptomyces sp. RTGN2]|uniref:serine/threonine-protein kinase n=1 Tax=Streptomyces sp. RTGN2 TaxID=3016525 RepID=UPI002553185D|nr:serine/threonine-protein kinase [Streptomyces sp. RTGN2]
MIKPLLHDDPSHIGPYRLAARLGSGGMGTVYLARTPGGATLALKTVHAHIAADAAFRTRFRLEADAARVIGGLHGAQVVDADPVAEVPWLATEYVLGPPLDDAVTVSGPLPESAVRAVGAALCGALGQLHRSDVVHRDLKPSNVMITAYGPKVIDFGIARALGDERLTRVGAAAGTPAFMSPEQATGQEHTPAGDVFALAGVLVFAATGHGPFGSGQPADLLYRVRYADPDLSGVPAALAPVLARCLAKDPALRPATDELATVLHDGHGEFADHLPHPLLSEISRRAAEVWQECPERSPAPEEPAVAAAPAPRRAVFSRRGLLALGGAAVAGVAAGGGLWLRSGRSDAKDSPGPAASGPPAGSGSVLWTSDQRLADEASPPLFVGKRIVVAAKGGELRSIDPADGSELWMFSQGLFEGRPVTDGTVLYWTTGVGTDSHAVITVDTETGEADRTVTTLSDLKLPTTASAELLCATADTVYLTAGATDTTEFDRHLYAVNARTGELRWRTALRSRNGAAYTGAFGKVFGDRIVLGQITYDLVLSAFDTDSGKELWSTPLTAAADFHSTLVSSGAQLADDGKHLYIGSTVLRSIGLSNGAVVWEFGRDRGFGTSGDGSDHYGPPAVRDGVVYAAEGSRGVVAVETARGELIWEVQVPESSQTTRVAPPVVSGKHLYYGDRPGLGVIGLIRHTYVRSLESTVSDFALRPGTDTLVGNGAQGQVEAVRLGS